MGDCAVGVVAVGCDYWLQASKSFQRRSQQVVEGLEEHVDPFDLDVFSPYLQANIMKATQRSAVSLCVCASMRACS